MKELIKLKTLLEIPPAETGEDSLLTVLLLGARTYMRTYCRFGSEEERLLENDALYSDVAVMMAAEDYGRTGSEGLEKRSAGGISESYHGSYSPRVMALLKRLRRPGLPGGCV